MFQKWLKTLQTPQKKPHLQRIAVKAENMKADLKPKFYPLEWSENIQLVIWMNQNGPKFLMRTHKVKSFLTAWCEQIPT